MPPDSSKLITADDRGSPLAFMENPSPESLQAALAEGNLAKLNTDQRLKFLAAVCESVGLNPLTQPFEFITFQGKIRLYAKRDCGDQLRKIHRVSVSISERQNMGDVFVVTARATMPDGRSDESIGAVPIKGLQGEALAIALMKCETKAKRRVALSICGLGFIDESEIEDAKAAEEQMQRHAVTGTTHPPRPEAEGMLADAELLPPEDTPAPRHWSELLLEDGYKLVKFSAGKWEGKALWEISREGDFEDAFKEVPQGDSIERLALDAAYFAKLKTRLQKKGYDLDEATSALRKAGFLPADKELTDIPGETLLDLGATINDLPKIES